MRLGEKSRNLPLRSENQSGLLPYTCFWEVVPGGLDKSTQAGAEKKEKLRVPAKPSKMEGSSFNFPSWGVSLEDLDAALALDVGIVVLLTSSSMMN